ncbi:MAG: RimK-like ATP-grasp domain [Thermoleophilia bacterium]|nr:RimK-like ATP-grasp domain [Thermoleophilia bacterium]
MAATIGNTGVRLANLGSDGARIAMEELAVPVRDLRVGMLTRANTGEPFNGAYLIDQGLRLRGANPVWIDSERAAMRGAELVQDGRPVGPLDFLMVRYPTQHGLDVMDALQARGVPLLNDRTAIATTSSKFNTQGVFDGFDTPRILTRFASNVDEAEAALKGLPDRVVTKPFDGEGGKGVEFFDDHRSALQHIRRHFAESDTMLLVQEEVPGTKVRWKTDAGDEVASAMDYRVLITRDRRDAPYVHTIMQRIGAPGSGTSNIDGGGWGRNVPVEEAPPQLVEAALDGYGPIPGTFDMGGVDVMPRGRAIDQGLDDHGADGFVVTETNSSPGIPDLRLGRDFAGAVAERGLFVAARSRAAAG